RAQVGLLGERGCGQFRLASHDRGARVAHRLVLDHPGTVSRLAVLDILPTRHVLHNVTRAVAAANYFWFFLATGNGIPEHMIAADPGYWVRAVTGQLLGEGVSIEREVMDDYIRCFRDPGTIAGSCADMRSALGVDLVHDDETFAAGQKVECPVLVLWGTQSMAASDPLGVWQQYAPDVHGNALPTGHFLPEEAPDLVSAALRDFLDSHIGDMRWQGATGRGTRRRPRCRRPTGWCGYLARPSRWAPSVTIPKKPRPAR